MSAALVELVQRLGRPRVLVVGDVMLDRYVWGDAERISQEAPVILLRADKREERLGGASSVATMLSALQADVCLVGLVGPDADARPTTVKERYIGRAQHKHPQQMLRVDFESRETANGPVEVDLISAVEAE